MGKPLDDYPSRDRILIPSTGDPEKDEDIISRYIRNTKRKMEGICPNDCGPLEYPQPGESHCPKCGFTGWEVTLRIGGQEEKK